MARSLSLGSLMVGSLAALSSAAGQCSSTVSLNVTPATPLPGRPYSVQVLPQNAQWTFEASADGGQSWIEIGQGTSSGVFGYTASLCATTILYRVRATSTCPGGGTYTSEAVQVSWPSILPQLTLNIEAEGLGPEYSVNIVPATPIAAFSVNGLVLEWSDDAGATWTGVPVWITSAWGEWITLPRPLCGGTRQHRLRSIACGGVQVGPIVEQFIPFRVPPIEIEVPWQAQAQSPYTVEVSRRAGSGFSIDVPGVIEVSDDGLTWQVVAKGVVGAEPFRATLGTTACRGMRWHRFTSTVCGETNSTWTALTVWPDLIQPGSVIAPSSIEPGAPYTVSATVPVGSGIVEYRDEQEMDWTPAGTIAGAGSVVLQAPLTPGIRAHRVRGLSSCPAPVLSPVAGTCVGSAPPPKFLSQPQPQSLTEGAVVVLSASLDTLNAIESSRSQWYRDGAPINDGPTPWGSYVFISAASSVTITGAREQDSGVYHVEIQTPCGVVVSQPARVSVCFANCDESTTEPLLSALDFTCFLDRYRATLAIPPFFQVQEYANCDGSTVDPVLNALDFTCFLARFRTSCP